MLCVTILTRAFYIKSEYASTVRCAVCTHSVRIVNLICTNQLSWIWTEKHWHRFNDKVISNVICLYRPYTAKSVYMVKANAMHKKAFNVVNCAMWDADRRKKKRWPITQMTTFQRLPFLCSFLTGNLFQNTFFCSLVGREKPNENGRKKCRKEFNIHAALLDTLIYLLSFERCRCALKQYNTCTLHILSLSNKINTKDRKKTNENNMHQHTHTHIYIGRQEF